MCRGAVGGNGGGAGNHPAMVVGLEVPADAVDDLFAVGQQIGHGRRACGMVVGVAAGLFGNLDFMDAFAVGDRDGAGRAAWVCDAWIANVDQVIGQLHCLVDGHRLAPDERVVVLVGECAGVALVPVLVAGVVDGRGERGRDVGSGLLMEKGLGAHLWWSSSRGVGPHTPRTWGSRGSWRVRPLIPGVWRSCASEPVGGAHLLGERGLFCVVSRESLVAGAYHGAGGVVA